MKIDVAWTIFAAASIASLFVTILFRQVTSNSFLKCVLLVTPNVRAKPRVPTPAETAQGPGTGGVQPQGAAAAMSSKINNLRYRFLESGRQRHGVLDSKRKMGRRPSA